MARILATGIATLDVVNTVDAYPAEDSEVRALSQRVARGGNATNTLVVLSQLGHDCAWAGVLSDEPDAAYITDDLGRYGIDTGPCRLVQGGKVPTSYVALSRATGSRTIVHYRDLPEYTYADFARVDLNGFDWLHFEGRAVEETVRMLERAQREAPGIPRSVEVEKPREGIEALFGLADVLLFSRVFAISRGYDRPFAFLRHLHSAEVGTADLVCTWGEDGAFALTHDGLEFHCPAFSPREVVDTLGAGDTFNAGIIDARARGMNWKASLESAAQLAGRKCGQIGFEGLVAGRR